MKNGRPTITFKLSSFQSNSWATVECFNLPSFSEMKCNSSLYDKGNHPENQNSESMANLLSYATLFFCHFPSLYPICCFMITFSYDWLLHSNSHVHVFKCLSLPFSISFKMNISVCCIETMPQLYWNVFLLDIIQPIFLPSLKYDYWLSFPFKWEVQYSSLWIQGVNL